MINQLIRNYELIISITKRDILSKYKGSMMGLLWNIVNPILMLGVYTFVFSVVFKTKWGGGGNSKAEFALVLFTGLMIFNIFSECINKAPFTIINNVNFVKKVVFPLEILAISNLLVSFFGFLMAFIVWLVFYIIIFGFPGWQIFFFPLVIAPLLLYTIGASWIISGLGVYIRDIGQFVSILTTMLLFLSPIFFPSSSLPENFKYLMAFNPMAYFIEQSRDLLIWGNGIKWGVWLVNLIISSFISLIGLALFRKLKKGFSDVL